MFGLPPATEVLGSSEFLGMSEVLGIIEFRAMSMEPRKPGAIDVRLAVCSLPRKEIFLKSFARADSPALWDWEVRKAF